MRLTEVDTVKDVEWYLKFDEDTGFLRSVPFQLELAQRCLQATSEDKPVTVLAVTYLALDRAVALFGADARHGALSSIVYQWRQLEDEGWLIGRYSQDVFYLASPVGVNYNDIPEQVLDVVGLSSLPVGVLDLPLEPCTGVAGFPTHGKDAAKLCVKARLAMEKGASEENESRQSSTWVVYEKAIGEVAERHSSLAKDLSKSFDQYPLSVKYSVEYDLDNQTPKDIGMEVFWEHPVYGPIGHREMFSIGRTCNLSASLGEKIVEVCFQSIADCKKLFNSRHVYTVPMPYEFLFHAKLNLRLQALIKKLAIKPSEVLFSVPAKYLANPDSEALRVVKLLNHSGFNLALTGFGEGQSHFSALTQWPIKKLYLSSDLLKSTLSQYADFSLLFGLVSLAESLKIGLIVEGVNNSSLLSVARRACAKQGAGSYFSGLLAAEGLIEVFDKTEHANAGGMSSSNEKPQLLIVDDEENVRNALRRLLRKDGYRIHLAGSADEAFEVLANHRIQVIISDQRMPGKSGTEMLNEVKKLYPETVRLVLSGYTELASVSDAINKGAIYKYLLKPWDDEELRANVKEAFNRYNLLQQNALLKQQLELANGDLVKLNLVLEQKVAENLEKIDRHLGYREVMQEILDNLPIGILGIGIEGDIALANKEAGRLLHKAKGFLLGEANLILPAPLLNQLNEILEGEDYSLGPVPFETSEGKVCHASFVRLGAKSNAKGCIAYLSEAFQ